VVLIFVSADVAENRAVWGRTVCLVIFAGLDFIFPWIREGGRE